MAELTEDGLDASTAPGRRRRPLRTVLIGLVALGVVAGGVLWFERERLTVPPEGCKIATAAGSGELDLSQAANASTITAVTLSRGLPERAATIALATAMQESKLRNLAGGDRDSVGLFQQRPSQGWGTAEQIADPVYATNKFLDSLVKIPGYARMPLTDAAQAVQKSGFPQAYAKHESNATLVADVFSGRAVAAVNCVVHDPAAVNASPTAKDLTDRVRHEFGRTVTAANADPAPKDLRAVVALTPQPGTSADTTAGGPQQGGWAVAQWAVAQAQSLGVGAVAYDGKVWRIDKPNDGWKPLTQGAPSDRVLVTLGVPPKH